MKYQSKNNSGNVWIILIALIIFDFIIVGSNTDSLGYILLPTIIGGGIGIFLLWSNNKDTSVSIEDNFLILKNNNSDIKKFEKNEINSYRVSKDQGKTVIRIVGNNKSEYEMTAKFLDLKGFEEAMQNFLHS